MTDRPHQLKAWTAYRNKPNRQTKQRLMETYIPVVRHVAGQIADRLPKSVERDELVSFGVFGLEDAITKFNPGHGDGGVPFSSFARQRIRGAILDGLRSDDHLPRSIRSAMKRYDEAVDHNGGKQLTDTEVATALKVPLDRAGQQVQLIERARVTSLDDSENNNHTDDLPRLRHSSSDPLDAGDSVEDSVGLHSLAGELAAAVNALPPREATIIALYYGEGLTLREVGTAIGLTESRICQLHHESLEGIQRMFDRRGVIEAITEYV